jgi:DNA repair protein RecO (recombination protein O)
MPIRHATSIVIRTHRVGEADKVVVFFTLEYGKLRGMARAARRPRSRFGSSLEVGTEVDLTFFEKEGRELVSVDRCDIVRSRFSQLGDPVLATTLGYVSDLVDSFAPEREPNKRLYRLLRAVIGSLSAREAAESKARYVEAWLLRLSGLHPYRRQCPSCGRLLAQEGAFYAPEEHRLGCGRCLRSGLSLSPEAVSALEEIWKLSPAALGAGSPRVLRELGVFHYRLMQEHLERDLKSHHVFEDMLRGEFAE